MIMFNGVWHEAKEMRIPEFGHVLISNMTVRNLLLNDDYEYSSIDAREVDEKIFFYVEDFQLNMDKQFLTKLITSHLK